MYIIFFLNFWSIFSTIACNFEGGGWLLFAVTFPGQKYGNLKKFDRRIGGQNWILLLYFSLIFGYRASDLLYYTVLRCTVMYSSLLYCSSCLNGELAPSVDGDARITPGGAAGAAHAQSVVVADAAPADDVNLVLV